MRWQFVIHDGIDRFSQMVVYFNAASNNQADTVLGCFCEAVNEYGLASRV